MYYLVSVLTFSLLVVSNVVLANLRGDVGYTALVNQLGFGVIVDGSSIPVLQVEAGESYFPDTADAEFLASDLFGNQLQTATCKLIRDLAQTNSAQARKVFFHAVALGKNSTFASDLVARIANEPTSLEVAVLGLDLIAKLDNDITVKR